jgi:small subunit ribosomal protein S3e
LEKLQGEQLKPGETLEMLLAKPWQRLMKYELFFKELLHDSEKLGDSTMQNMVSNALQKAKQLAGIVNDAQMFAGVEAKYQDLLHKLDNLSDLHKRDRKLLGAWEEACTMRATHNNDVEARGSVYLFNNGLLLCKPQVGAKPLAAWKPMLPVTNERMNASKRVSNKDLRVTLEMKNVPSDENMLQLTDSQDDWPSCSTIILTFNEPKDKKDFCDQVKFLYKYVKSINERGDIIPQIEPDPDDHPPGHFNLQPVPMTQDARNLAWLSVAWFTLVYLIGALGHTGGRFTSTFNTLCNIFIKWVGYFAPFAASQALSFHYQDARHLNMSENAIFFEKCEGMLNALGGWAYLYIISRFIMEPLMGILLPIIVHADGSKGPASHAILTYIVWGYSFLGADVKWFAWPPRTFSAAVNWFVLGVLAYVYTYMAYITTRYFHTPIEWLVALFVAFIVIKGYTLLYDHEKFLSRHSSMLLPALFAVCAFFVLLICPYVILRKVLSGGTFRLKSSFMQIFASDPYQATILCLLLGSFIIFISLCIKAGGESKKRKFVADGVFYAELNELLTRELSADGYAGVEVRVTPLKTEIIIRATRARDVLGDKGRRIRELTSLVQKRFKFPEGSVELYAERVNNRGLCAIAQCESVKFKLIGGLACRRACYGVVRFVMESGAKGCEVTVAGKLRGARAKNMKFKDGYFVTSGEPARMFIEKATRHVCMRMGMIGITVKIMLPWDPEGKLGPKVPMPDVVTVFEPKDDVVPQPQKEKVDAPPVAAY